MNENSIALRRELSISMNNAYEDMNNHEIKAKKAISDYVKANSNKKCSVQTVTNITRQIKDTYFFPALDIIVLIDKWFKDNKCKDVKFKDKIERVVIVEALEKKRGII